MKAGLKAFLICCHVGALVCAAIGGRLLVAGKTGAILVFAAVIVSLVALIVQYVVLGFWNPLKLFKKAHVEIAGTEVTKAPWAH